MSKTRKGRSKPGASNKKLQSERKRIVHAYLEMVEEIAVELLKLNSGNSPDLLVLTREALEWIERGYQAPNHPAERLMH